MNLDKQKKFLISFAYYGILVVGIYLIIRFLASPMMPFILGFLVAWMLRRPSAWLAKKLHLPHKIPSLLLTAMFYVLVISLLLILAVQLGGVLGNFLPRLPDLVNNQILPFINTSIDVMQEFLLEQFNIDLVAQFDIWFSELSSTIISMITSFSTSVVKFVSGIATGMPSIILKIVLTVISTFYFSLDFDRITMFLLGLLPQKARNGLSTVKRKGFRSLKIFARSYILVFIMTAAELSLGLLILGIPYPALLGLIIALVDILPVLGTGLVLLPWGLICLIVGNIKLGVGIFILYIIITLIRNVVEPKLVGNQIGLHPLATLISMFVGLQLFGLIGLFAFPVTLSILAQFKDDMGEAYKKQIGTENTATAETSDAQNLPHD